MGGSEDVVVVAGASVASLALLSSVGADTVVSTVGSTGALVAGCSPAVGAAGELGDAVDTSVVDSVGAGVLEGSALSEISFSSGGARVVETACSVA